MSEKNDVVAGILVKIKKMLSNFYKNRDIKNRSVRFS